jgi:hypothetical protein
VAHAGEIGAKAGAAGIVERRLQASPSGGNDNRLQRRQHPLAVGLPEWNEPRAR